MKQDLKLPVAIAAILGLVIIIWFVARATILKPPPEPPKLHPNVKVRPNMPADEAAKIFSIPTGQR